MKSLDQLLISLFLVFAAIGWIVTLFQLISAKRRLAEVQEDFERLSEQIQDAVKDRHITQKEHEQIRDIIVEHER